MRSRRAPLHPRAVPAGIGDELTDRQAAAAGRAGDRGRPGPPRPGAGPVFVAGQLFALLADGIFLVALPVLVRRGGGDAGSLGGILAGYGLARLVGFPIGGWLADRWGGRAGMLGADGVRVVLMIALGALGGAGVVGAGNLSVPTIGALVAAFGLVDGVFWPASTSVVRAWLPADRQPRGVSLLASVRTAAAMGGAVAGGPMVLGGRTRAGFLVAAGSFALSALAVAGIRRRPRLPATSSTTGPAAPGPGAIVVPDDGTASRARWSTVIRHMIESPVTRLALLVTVVLNLAYLGLTEVTLPSFALSDLGGGAAYGVVMTGFGAGAIIGVFGGVALVRRARRGRIALGLGLLQGVALVVGPLGHSLAVLTAAMLVGAGLQSALTVLLFTMLRGQIHSGLIGRVLSLLATAAGAAFTVSVAVLGRVVRVMGPSTVLVAGGLVVAASFALGLLSQDYRNL